MATFVIVHGGWGGGWEWTPVAQALRNRGHDVFTPTLTGMGERAHLGSPQTGLSVHIDDVLALLTYEDIHDVILCGHSYGGVVVTGAADRAPDRIRLLAYLDGFIPRDGQSMLDTVPAEVAELVLAPAEVERDGMVPYPPALHPPEGFIAEETRSAYLSRTRSQPVATLTEPIHLSGAVDRVHRAYVHCTIEGDLLAPFAAHARAQGWPYRELATEHDLHLLSLEGTVAVLDDLATVP